MASGASMNITEYWTKKPNDVIRYETVEFQHVDIDTVKLVANQYDAVTLGGVEYTPVAMSVNTPQQDRDPIASVTAKFPRAVVGEAFKQALKQIQPLNRIQPIKMIVSVWFSFDVSAPQQSWELFVAENGIVFTGDSVQVTGTDDNPMIQGISTIYDPAVFTGLEVL